MESCPILAAAFAAIAAPAGAQETRETSAHEHGVGTVEIAVEDGTVMIDLHAPGMDIAGFEYGPESPADIQAVSDAVMQLTRASGIVELDAAAGCRPVEALAHRHGEDHAEHEDGEAHAEDEHAEGGHSEFHARYVFACEDADALATVSFPFFERFGRARLRSST